VCGWEGIRQGGEHHIKGPMNQKRRWKRTNKRQRIQWWFEESRLGGGIGCVKNKAKQRNLKAGRVKWRGPTKPEAFSGKAAEKILKKDIVIPAGSRLRKKSGSGERAIYGINGRGD